MGALQLWNQILFLLNLKRFKTFKSVHTPDIAPFMMCEDNQQEIFEMTLLRDLKSNVLYGIYQGYSHSLKGEYYVLNMFLLY